MNRPVFLLLLLLVTILIGSCRDQGRVPGGSGGETVRSGGITVSDPVQDSLRTDSLLDCLWQLECAVAEKPGDRKRARMLLSKSLDTAAGCFCVVGKGLKNPGLPEAARTPAQKLAAQYAAEKWALFLKNLSEGDKTRYGAQIAGRVLYKKDLRSRIAGDSLFVLVMVPAGSVAVKR
jgi:hypothetical protein